MECVYGISIETSGLPFERIDLRKYKYTKNSAKLAAPVVSLIPD